MSSMEDKEWPLDVLRRDSSGNWQKRVPSTTDPNDGGHHLKPHATGMPKVGCIVVKRFRLRIALGGSKTDQATRKEKPKEENGSMEVVRRENCILLTSTKRHRALLLKFTCVRDCLEFSDRLLALNPSLNLAMAANGPAVAATPAPMKSLMGMIQAQNHEELQAQEQYSAKTDTLSFELQRNNIFSILVRTFQDPGFKHFVDSIENCLVSSPDGVKLLLAAMQSSSSTTASTEPEQRDE